MHGLSSRRMDSPFVANVRDLPWMSSEAMGDICTFESDGRRFEQVGYNLAVLQPGQRGAQYHRELDNQKTFSFSPARASPSSKARSTAWGGGILSIAQPASPTPFSPSETNRASSS